jgi:hypothetical protein
LVRYYRRTRSYKMLKWYEFTGKALKIIHWLPLITIHYAGLHLRSLSCSVNVSSPLVQLSLSASTALFQVAQLCNAVDSMDDAFLGQFVAGFATLTSDHVDDDNSR